VYLYNYQRCLTTGTRLHKFCTRYTTDIRDSSEFSLGPANQISATVYTQTHKQPFARLARVN